MCGAARRIIRTVCSRLISIVLRQSSSVLSSRRRPPVDPPTLLTSTSMPPCAETAASTSCWACFGTVVSATTAVTEAAVSRNFAACSSSTDWVRAEMTRWQPSEANEAAVARPMPRLAPVMSTTAPFSFRSIVQAATGENKAAPTGASARSLRPSRSTARKTRRKFMPARPATASSDHPLRNISARR